MYLSATRAYTIGNMKKSSPARKNTSTKPDSVAAAMLAGALYSFGVSVTFVLAMLALPLAMHASGDILTALDWWMRSVVWLLIGLGAVVFMIGSLILKANRFQSPYVYGLVGGACIAALSMPLGTWLIPLKLPVNTFMVTVILVEVIGAAVFGVVYWLLRRRFAYAFVVALLVTSSIISVGATSWLGERTAHAGAVRFVDVIPYKIFIPPRDSGWTQPKYYSADGSYIKSSFVQADEKLAKDRMFEQLLYRPVRENTLPRENTQGPCLQENLARWELASRNNPRVCEQIAHDQDELMTVYLERDAQMAAGVKPGPYVYYMVRGGTVTSTWDDRRENNRQQMLRFLRELKPATSDEWGRLHRAHWLTKDARRPDSV